ncbi:MAG TPA: MBL fold metallo-hydrolase, partial [Candidatus Paceibacterota bacterium]
FGKNTTWLLLVVLLVASVFVVYAVFVGENDGLLTVSFLDVGQGDAIFIEAPNGTQMLVDAGSGKQVLRELQKVMPFYDRSIDIVLATHPDKDHIGGMPGVLERFFVSQFIEPGVLADSGTYTALLGLVESERAKHVLARRGMKIRLDENVYFEILFPDRDVSGLETNTASVVGKLVYRETSFLLTGDSPKNIEHFLVTLDGNLPVGNLDVDVLKAGHHGSKTSSSEEFVMATSPEFTVISAGKDNQYGHPHREVVELLRASGTAVLETSKGGMIVFTSDGNSVRILRGRALSE